MTAGGPPKALLSSRPIVAFIGPLGTGKTEIAINYSLASLAAGRATCLADLDVVTPYFRVGDYREQLAAKGLRVLAPPGRLARFETPALSPELAGALGQDDLHLVLDVGGDPEGARLLGAYAPQLSARGYDLWMVINPFRPDVSARGPAEQRRLTERASGLQITGLAANPHLGPMTEPSHLERGWRALREAAQQLRLPIVFLAVAEHLAGRLPPVEVPVLPLHLCVRLPWESSYR